METKIRTIETVEEFEQFMGEWGGKPAKRGNTLWHALSLILGMATGWVTWLAA